MLGLADNPFTPGAGLTPAYMGRRPKVERALLRLLGAVRNNSSGAHAALLFGPRGNGKTVLLNWFERQAHGTDDGQPIAVVRFSSRDLADARRMNEAIDKTASQWASGWQRLGRIFAGSGNRSPAPDRESLRPRRATGGRLANWLEKGKGPLLLTVDEPHGGVASGAYPGHPKRFGGIRGSARKTGPTRTGPRCRPQSARSPG